MIEKEQTGPNWVPCDICGEPTSFLGTRRCTNCWEVESRLEKYLQSSGGLKWARNKMPLLDDWVDGLSDAWDYEKVLTENEVEIECCATVVDNEGAVRKSNCCSGWSLSWESGTMYMGETTEVIARKAAALFVSLWLRGVSASFADKLMDGYIGFLERQEGITKGVMASVITRKDCAPCYLRLSFGTYAEESHLLREFGFKVGDRAGVSLSKEQSPVEGEKHPTKVGRERYPPDGYYTANGDNIPCTCKKTCPSNCKGQCGCLACHDAYGDFLSSQG